MDKRFSIVTACTPDYLDRLKWAFSSWRYKKQFRDVPFICFHAGFGKVEPKELSFIKNYYKDWTFVDWKVPKAETQREVMLSSFILGHEYVKTPFAVKIDADTWFHTDEDVFTDNDFNYDVVSHRWGYTKPGWWIQELDNFYNGTSTPVDKQAKTVFHRRIQSICCLQRTEFVKQIADKFDGRLPVPSHDTVLWYYANKDGKLRTKNLKGLGVDHAGRKSSKYMREQVCSYPCCASDKMTDDLVKNVQLEITSACNVGCNQCDRNCGLIPCNDEMTIRQIVKFVEESICANKQWHRIDIIGGEPTLHKKLKEILDVIYIYKSKFPRVKIRFSTNGYSEHTDEVLKTLPGWVHVRNSKKTAKENSFDAYHIAPIDCGIEDIRSCSIPWRCGLGLSKYGYFLCGAGASLARVFGFDIGIKDLGDVTPGALMAQRVKLCKYCGHANTKAKKETKIEELSDSWKKAIEDPTRKDKLTIY